MTGKAAKRQRKATTQDAVQPVSTVRVRRRIGLGKAVLVLLLVLVGSVAAVAPARKLLDAQIQKPKAAAMVTPLPQVPAPRVAVADTAIPDVWLVDANADQETYSNGLRIEKRYAIRHLPRKRYKVFDQSQLNARKFDWREKVTGIVFHTTESQVAPFREASNEELKSRSRGIIAEVRRKNAYHYVIDRVGRVWRVVDERDIAWHAGRSVWADDAAVYVELNDGFLGVAFEAQSDSKSEPLATAAQIRAAGGLVELLRSKYQIEAANCVTHAQVSVSLWNGKLGYHTDWSSGFPFADLGLPDNYRIATPALWAFGFEYDDVFRQVLNQRLWPGLGLAEQHLDRHAMMLGATAESVRKGLQLRYREIIQTLDSDESETHATKPAPIPEPAPERPAPSMSPTRPAIRPSTVAPKPPVVPVGLTTTSASVAAQ